VKSVWTFLEKVLGFFLTNVTKLEGAPYTYKRLPFLGQSLPVPRIGPDPLGLP